MKQWIVIFLSLAALLALAGCSPAAHWEVPFDATDIAFIEMYHYEGAPAAAEKKVVTDREKIDATYRLLQKAELKQGRAEAYVGAAVTSFRFALSDGTNYEIIYVENGVKSGTIRSSGGEADYLTSADIGWCWSQLDPDLVAEPAAESELPKGYQ